MTVSCAVPRQCPEKSFTAVPAKYRFSNRMREYGVLVVLSTAAFSEAIDKSALIKSPVKHEHNEFVYDSQLAGQSLPEWIMPEKEMLEPTNNCMLVPS